MTASRARKQVIDLTGDEPRMMSLSARQKKELRVPPSHFDRVPSRGSLSAPAIERRRKMESLSYHLNAPGPAQNGAAAAESHTLSTSILKTNMPETWPTPSSPLDFLHESEAPSTPASKKRKMATGSTGTKTKAKATGALPKEEKRLRRFRTHAPGSFLDIYDRALTQRFYVLERTRGGSDECPEETVELTGSTGNIYTIHIARQPTCNCPHAENGHQCKHVIYVSTLLEKPSKKHI